MKINKPTNKWDENFLKRCQNHKIETDITKRWESGREHHTKSETLMNNIMAADYLFNNDGFNWKTGGDGDNGEETMFLLDIIFDLEDSERENNPKS